MSHGFAGKTVIVTGSASGIGQAVALMVAGEGGRVGCLDVDGAGLAETEKLAADLGAGTLRSSVADVSSGEEVARSLAELGFESVEILFNVAGVITNKPLLECTTADLAWVMGINVGSVITMTANVVPLMKPGGVIVNTSSSAVFKVARGGGLYTISKEAIVTITKFMAHELSELGIRVCAIGPGGVDTPMPRRQLAERGVIDFDAGTEILESLRLIKPIAQPDEMAEIMGYLASDKARYCTGSTWWVDGGTAAMG